MEGIQKGLKSKKISSYQKLKEKHQNERLSLLHDIQILIGDNHVAKFGCTVKWKMNFEINRAYWFGKSID